MAIRALVRPSIIILVAVALGATACAQTFDATTLGVEATMASPVSAPAEGERFHVSKKAVFLLFGAVPVSKPSLQQVLAAQVTGNAQIADLRVKVRSRWTDVLLSVLTVGLVVPRTVTYEGIVVGQ